MRAGIFLSTIAALAVSAPATAHIVFADPAATAGSYYAGFLRVGHGCGAAGTTEVRVDIPAEILSVRPQPKPGWKLLIEREPLAQPITGEGGAIIKDRVKAVIWTGELPSDQFDQFGVMMKLPNEIGPLYFPTHQRCTTGDNEWINIPATPEAWHMTPMPAPMLMLLSGGHGDRAAHH